MPPGQQGQPAELWMGDHETNPPNQFRFWSQKLIIQYMNELGPLDLSKIVFFRVFNGRDPKCKGKTYRLMAPYIHLVKASIQLIVYGDVPTDPKVVEKTAEILAEEKMSPAFVIAIYDDKHASDADRLRTLLHELYHIDPGMLKLRDHDLKDHAWMVERYGIGNSADLTEFETMLA
jgi:hypothetical protein